MTTEQKIKKKPGPPKGKPYKEIDWKEVDLWLKVQRPVDEIAAYFGVSTDLFYKRCLTDNNTDFSNYRQSRQAVGKAHIALAQYKKAVDLEDASLLKWLGQVILKQVAPTIDQNDIDKISIDKNNADHETIKALAEKDKEIAMLKQELANRT